MTIARDPATDPAGAQTDTKVGAAPSPPAPRPQEGVWPGLATPPNSALIARGSPQSLFWRRCATLPVRVVFPGG